MADYKMNIESKLLAIQSKLHAPKNQYNKFGKYSYRSCEDILEAVKPLLSEVGATLRIKDDVIQVGDRFYIKATATLTDVNEPCDSIESSAFAREEDNKAGMSASQISGSTSSYARKYCLNGLFCIDDCKDSDTNEQHDESVSRASKKIICSNCQNLVTERDYNGKHYTASGIASIAQSKHKRVLCWDCMTTMKG